MISKNKIKKIIDIIVSNYQPQKIILFGSYAYGNPTESSDVDLLIIKNTSKPRHKRGKDLWKYLYGSMIPLDLIIYTPQEVNDEKDNKYSFIYKVLKSGQVLYEG